MLAKRNRTSGFCWFFEKLFLKMRLNRIWGKHITLFACSNSHTYAMHTVAWKLFLFFQICFSHWSILPVWKKVWRRTSFWFRYVCLASDLAPIFLFCSFCAAIVTVPCTHGIFDIFYSIWVVSVFVDELCGKKCYHYRRHHLYPVERAVFICLLLSILNRFDTIEHKVYPSNRSIFRLSKKTTPKFSCVFFLGWNLLF